MGIFEQIGLQPPSNEELSRPKASERAELERELQQERQELSEVLAGIYDEADELGIELDAEYDHAGNISYQAVRERLLSQRARTAIMLEQVEANLDKLAKWRGVSRASDA